MEILRRLPNTLVKHVLEYDPNMADICFDLALSARMVHRTWVLADTIEVTEIHESEYEDGMDVVVDRTVVCTTTWDSTVIEDWLEFEKRFARVTDVGLVNPITINWRTWRPTTDKDMVALEHYLALAENMDREWEAHGPTRGTDIYHEHRGYLFHLRAYCNHQWKWRELINSVGE